MKREGDCVRCGHCCRAVWLGLGLSANPTEAERTAANDFLLWAEFHPDVIIRKVNDNAYELGLFSPCKHLVVESGKSRCAIYDERPKICREFPASPNPNCKGFRFVE